tara:strand:+ start:290 stop:556 length:267 start_codon:yes stop_codon:yes gene_type:complete
MATKKNNWDGRSRPSNDKYQKNYDEIFGKKEIQELKESYKQSLRNKKERADPLANFNEDLQESIHKRTYKRRKEHATDMSYENESKKK